MTAKVSAVIITDWLAFSETPSGVLNRRYHLADGQIGWLDWPVLSMANFRLVFQFLCKVEHAVVSAVAIWTPLRLPRINDFNASCFIGSRIT